MPLRLFVIKPVEERERELRHPVVDAIRAEPEYLPDASSLTAPLHRWRRADLRAVHARAAARRCAAARSASPARSRTALGQALRDRRTPLSGPRKIYIKELLQAIALADRLLDAPDVRHLHAHFAHGTTTITWLAARIAGLPFSFTGHARDIYAAQLNPKGWLRRKLLAARFVVTCTGANVRHLAGDRPGRGRPPRLPRPQRRLRAAARRARAPGRRATARCACSASAAWWPRRASTCSSTRAPSCAAGRAVRGGDRRPGRQARRRRARAHRGPRPRAARAAARPDGAGRAAARVPARERAVHAVPAAGRRPRRHPQRARRGDGGRRAGVASGVSGIPELVEHEVNGLLVAPEDPEALADALLRLHGDPALAARLARSGRETVASGSTAPRLAQPSSRGCSRRRSRHDERPPPAARARCSASPRTSTATARAPRRSRAGRFKLAGETRTLGTEPDWLRRRPAGRRGVADRVGEVRLRPRPRPRLRGRPATAATRRRGSGWSPRGSARCPPDHDAGEVTARRILNWIYAWQALRAGRAELDGAAALAASPSRSRHVRANLAPERNHRTLELYALLIAALALPELDRGGAARLRRRRARPQPRAPTSAPTACTARPRRTTT